jgi:hypothetical protein
MQIELTGLTPKQKVFCEVMWSISTQEGVEAFIASLPKADQRTCRSLIEMMQLAFSDQVDTVSDEVLALIDRVSK